MKRSDMIRSVLARLEELSPYNAPSAFIADSGIENVVRPVWSYADAFLDEAIKDAVAMLPLVHLKDDITKKNVNATIDTDGVGHVNPPYTNILRLAFIQFADWERSVTQAYDENTDAAKQQCNKYTRGGVCKPAVVWHGSENEWRCYSFPLDGTEPRTEPTTRCGVVLLPNKANDDGLNTQRAIDYAVILCAIKVQEVYGNTANVKALREELQVMMQLDNIQI